MDISTLVDKVRSGQLDLQPDFQRGQVWSESKKKRLIDTILRMWYVPAVHIVVNDALDKEEVLDGQQRLRTIIEFMDGEFAIDGNIEPYDENIQNLNGLYYVDLPDVVRSRFKRFTVTTVRLRGYEPEEPGELFFRLNQLTALTAAEQRNALIGEPRNQIKRLAEKLDEAFPSSGLGFSNTRLNYDDVLSRLAVALEHNSLSIKLTAASLENRYRMPEGFSRHVVDGISNAIGRLSYSYLPSYRWKQNKATLFSWLFFMWDQRWLRSEGSQVLLSQFFNLVEALRDKTPDSMLYLIENESNPIRNQIVGSRAVQAAIRIFNDRSSSRVNDVSSLVLRDACLNIALAHMPLEAVANDPDMRSRFNALRMIIAELSQMTDDLSDQTRTESRIFQIWEKYREARSAG